MYLGIYRIPDGLKAGPAPGRRPKTRPDRVSVFIPSSMATQPFNILSILFFFLLHCALISACLILLILNLYIVSYSVDIVSNIRSLFFVLIICVVA